MRQMADSQNVARLHHIDSMTSKTLDLLVIGGGASGAAIAAEAIGRGLDTGILDKGDFGGGVSSHCYKMIHGGIRYLQHLNLQRLITSAWEQNKWIRLAPHMVTPLSIAIPTRGVGLKSKWFLGAGMLLYDLLTFFRRLGIKDPENRIKPIRFVSSANSRQLFPFLPRGSAWTGAAVFDDAQMHNPSRLVWLMIAGFIRDGGFAANYLEVTDIQRECDGIYKISAVNRIEGGAVIIRSRSVVTAVGPWSNRLLPRLGMNSQGLPEFYSRDFYFALPRLFLGDLGVAFQGKSIDVDQLLGRGSRHMFIVPWRNFHIVGVWHKVVEPIPDQTSVTKDEIDSLIEEIRELLPEVRIDSADLKMVGFGLVPFGQHTRGSDALSFGHESTLLTHFENNTPNGLFTAVAVRYTVARQDARRIIRRVVKFLGKGHRRLPTFRRQVPGGDYRDLETLKQQAFRDRPDWLSPQSLEGILRNFGSDYLHVIKPAIDDERLRATVGSSATLAAEVTFAAMSELAVKAVDVIFRRTDIGQAGHANAQSIQAVIDLMGALLLWSDQRKASELEEVEQYIRRYNIGT